MIKSSSRRDFLKKFSLAIASLPFAGLFSRGITQATAGSAPAAAAASLPTPPAGMVATDMNGPLAKALGLAVNVKAADAKRFPQASKKEAANQKCGNCSFYTEVKEGWGNCTLLPGAQVHNAQWCGSWQKKPEKKA
jgi:hypothetical protein